MLDIDTNDLYISECCFAHPATELDMSTVKYGGVLRGIVTPIFQTISIIR